MFQLSDYHYELPEELIANHPVPGRDGSKLLVINRDEAAIEHRHFKEMVDLLEPGDLLVVNDTKVVPARLHGTKSTGGKVEVLILDWLDGLKSLEETGHFEAECLVKASKRPKVGNEVSITEALSCEVVGFGKNSEVRIRFCSEHDVVSEIEKAGELPLPPYIERKDGVEAADSETYQTVYATHQGAVAAPTAGLHFTPELMARLEKKGVEIARITLHVGYGTFMPVRVDDIREHTMHSERYVISPETADAVNRAKTDGRRVVAVGTTSVRTLEYAADENGMLAPHSGACDLFIYPGYTFKTVGAIITNFHLPETTLMMLVSAFAGFDNVMNAYRAAVKNRYRFFSYGDSMLIR